MPATLQGDTYEHYKDRASLVWALQRATITVTIENELEMAGGSRLSRPCPLGGTQPGYPAGMRIHTYHTEHKGAPHLQTVMGNDDTYSKFGDGEPGEA